MQGNLHVRFLEGGGAERLRLHSVRLSPEEMLECREKYVN